MKKKVLLFTKKNFWCDEVIEYCQKNFDCDHFYRLYDLKASYGHYDYIISFLSPDIIPKHVLDIASIAVNFHPAPPKYPGIGGYNFALYNEDPTYGCVCHIMEEKVDSGRILAKRDFPILKTDTVLSLQRRTMAYMLNLFYTIMNDFETGIKLSQMGDYRWEREPYTREDLNDLCKIEPKYESVEKIQCFDKWYNACYYPNAKDKPHIESEWGTYYIVRDDHMDELSISSSDWLDTTSYYYTNNNGAIWTKEVRKKA